MGLTAAYKYLNIKDTSNHKTKAVERSQNSGDLYPTWYNKYERSAWFVGEGCRNQTQTKYCISGKKKPDGFFRGHLNERKVKVERKPKHKRYQFFLTPGHNNHFHKP